MGRLSSLRFLESARSQMAIKHKRSHRKISRGFFKHLNEDEEGALSKDTFTRIIRSFMKVTKETVLAKDKTSTDGSKLSVGAVVELLQNPVKEKEATRVNAKLVTDGSEGWITVQENDEVYLEEFGGCFKVVKETILTDSFDLGEKKEVTRSLHQTTRKLTVGEIVEVREWPKKEETTSLMRMQCRAKSDGAVGWATTLGNTGTVFLSQI